MTNIAVIGAGHNGLVCACYLARAGHQVTVFETHRAIGGACRHEMWPSGAIISPGANHFGMFSPVVAQELGVDLNDLQVEPADPALIVGVGPHESLALFNDFQKTKQEIARFDPRDCDGYEAFSGDIDIVRRIVRLVAHDPRATQLDFEDALRSAGNELVPRFLTGSIRETVEAYFRDRAVQAAFAATTVLYDAAPSAKGTAFAFSYLSLSEVSGVPGWGVPRGGMGRLPAVLGMLAESLGVTIVPSNRVDRIEISNGQVRGLLLSDGTKYACDLVVSNADPYTTFVKLAGMSEELFSGLEDRAFYGPCAKFNFTFRGDYRPQALCEAHISDLRKSVYVYLPSVDFYENAFGSAETREYSEEPYFEFISPTGFDPNLAPSPMRTGSIYLLFANYRSLSALSAASRAEMKNILFGKILAFLNIHDVVESELLDPLDIEEKFGFHLGNVDHGPQLLSNLFDKRGVHLFPLIEGLTICGSGAHPGGLVTGIPGRNAALRILC